MPPRPTRVGAAERPRGSGRYSVRWREHGRQREERGYPNLAAAQTRASEIQRRLRSGLSDSSDQLTVADVVREFWVEHVRAGNLEESTAHTYKRTLPLVLEYPISLEPAASLTTGRIQRHTKQLADAGASPHNVRNMLSALSSAFQRCIEWGYLDTNPVRGVRRPSTKRRPIVVPTVDEILRLSMTVPEPDAKWRSLLLVAAYCGLRPQEQFALTWAAIEPKRIHVTQAVSGVGRSIKQPKTDRSTRRVPLPAFVGDTLDVWHGQTDRPEPDSFIWGTQIGSCLTNPSFGERIWRPWRETAGVTTMWRHFRHHYASEVAASGATMLQGSRWMGHSSHRMFDLYAFLFDDDEDAVMDRMTERLG